MTKRSKKKLVISIICYLAGLHLIIGLGLYLLIFDPFTPLLLKKEYSDDGNFDAFSSELIAADEPSSKDDMIVIYVDEMIFMGNEPKGSKTNNSLCLWVFSPTLEQTYYSLKQCVGYNFTYYADTTILYNGHCPVVIQITINGEELLSFNDGKSALLNWVDSL